MKEKSSNQEPMTNGFSGITLKVIAENFVKGFKNYLRPALLLLGFGNITLNQSYNIGLHD